MKIASSQLYAKSDLAFDLRTIVGLLILHIFTNYVKL